MSGITLAVFDLFVTANETEIEPNFNSFSEIEMKNPLSYLRILTRNFLPKESDCASKDEKIDILIRKRNNSILVKSFHLIYTYNMWKCLKTVSMKILQTDDITYKRLQSLLDEFISIKQQDVDMNDLLNELIDNYQESHWGAIGAGAGGG